MSRDERDEPFVDEDEPRSVASALWFRLALVAAVVGIIGVIAVPRALDWIHPRAAPPPAAPVAATSPAPAPAQPLGSSSGERTEASAPAPPAAAPPAAGPRAAPDPAGPATPSIPPTTAAAAISAPAAGDSEGPAAPSAKMGAADYWVQVAAFKEREGALRLASQLRAQNFAVAESTATVRDAAAGPGPTPSAATAGGGGETAGAAGGSRYDVLVSGAAPAEIGPRLVPDQMRAEPAPGGSIVRPSLGLADAVALSKKLAADGFKVQVRRVAPAEAGAAMAARTSEARAPMHRVRVGPFADRAAAAVALQELEAKGYKPFIARGRP